MYVRLWNIFTRNNDKEELYTVGNVHYAIQRFWRVRRGFQPMTRLMNPKCLRKPRFVLYIPRRSWELGIPPMSLHRTLYKNLGLKPYKVVLTKKLQTADHQQRGFFAVWVSGMHENEPKFHRKIILTDEAYFHFAGYAN